MISDSAMAMSAELRDELARNERRKIVDPRAVPLRFHHLRARGRSAAHCFESFQSDNESSLALRLGKGTHAMLFGQRVAVFDQPAKKGKGRAPRNGDAWETFKKQHADATILSKKEHDTAIRIATAIKSHPEASRLLFGPGVVHEQTIEWTQQGRARRSTPDARGPRHLVELKTTKCADPDRFVRDGSFRAYHAQLADQSNAIEAVTGSRPETVHIVAVESVPPYIVQVFDLTPRALEQGERLLRLWFELFMESERSNSWPGYCASSVPFDVPDPNELDVVFGDDDEDEPDEPGDEEGVS